ncbi:MAG: multiheme c-type cytochrome, partial [Candidatus Poribacteria bacterium]|nr:multiheme c-type cytochrome [Candidatus Poribacteria bacterium]
MKKYVLLTLILTVVVVGPFVYQQWSEAKRLRYIRETKQLASQIHATSLVDYLHQLKEISSDRVPLLLFTGNTQAQLEPCGCFIGQSGGLPRRAKAIANIRENGFSPLLVDLGGLQPSQHLDMKPHSFESDDPSTDTGVLMRDQHRVQTTLTAMEMIGYDAFFPFDAETEILQNRKVNLPLTFLTQDFDTYEIKMVEGKRIGLVALDLKDSTEVASVSDKLNVLMSEIQAQSDFVVGLSHSPIEVNRALAREYPSFSTILSPYEGETEKIGDVLLAYCHSKGKTLGALMLSDGVGDISSKVQQIALTESVSDDPDVRKLLDDFYYQITIDHQLQIVSHRLFASEPLEQDDKNSYIGSQACQECHQKEFSQWSHASHATAFNTLRTVGREYYPECVTCHVTGLGYESGYEIGNSERAHLVDVGCETCHGPGKQHAYTPLKENIRGQVPEKVCMECHTPEHSPGFDQLIEYVMSEVDHSRTELSLKQILEQRMRGPMKPDVELFVMSYCPYGVQAEQELLPFLETYGDTIDFKLRFIIGKEEASAENASGDIRFTSLHGEPELMENKRQMVIAELYPEKLFDYLLCRAGHLQEAWVNCAKDVGLDVGRIAEAVEAEKLTLELVQEIQRTKELNVKGSPTLVIDG